MDTDWSRRVRAAFADTAPPDDDVIEELAQHAAALYAASRADGCPAEAAERRVEALLERWRQDAGNLRRQARPVAVTPPPMEARRWLAGAAQDLRYAFRILWRHPGPAILTIALLAIGIGATTALFGIVYGVLLRPLPWPDADRLVIVTETRGGSPARFGRMSNAAYWAWRDQPATIDDLAAWSTRLATVGGAGAPERVRIAAATSSLFDVLGARPFLGSVFGAHDETSPVVVLSEGLWRDRYAADPSIVGTGVLLDGRPHTVVAVVADRLMFPDRTIRAIVPLAVPPASANALSMVDAVARLRPGTTATEAAGEASARARLAVDGGMAAMAIFGRRGPVDVTAKPLADAFTADVRDPLLVLLLAVGLLMLAATASAAGLQLTRVASRARELAIRAALGAEAGRVTRQVSAESLLIGLIGSGAGLGIARLLDRAIPTLLPADFPRAADVRVDIAVLGLASAIAVGVSVVCAVLPARRLRRLDIVAVLADDGAAPVGVGKASMAARTRTTILTLQTAVACVLLVGASLLGRSFVAQLGADRGYDPNDVLSARLAMPAAQFPDAVRRFAMVEHVLARLAATPGVTEAAFTSELPLTPGGSTASLSFRSPRGESVTAQASPRIVSPRFFTALRVRTIAGRTFSALDTDASPRVVVVNETFARRYLGSSPLGARLPVAAYAPPDRPPPDATVVGVVADARYIGREALSQPELYYCHCQFEARLPVLTVTLLVRGDGAPDAIAPAMAVAARDADPQLVADAVMPLEQRLLATSLARPRLYAAVLAMLAAVALTIAGVGVFGLVSFWVSLRSRELAIRVTLGASRAGIVGLVLAQGVGVALGGVVAGLAVAAGAARLAGTQLYGVTTYDPATFIGVPIVLLSVAATASLLPAWRAATRDPLRTLRGA